MHARLWIRFQPVVRLMVWLIAASWLALPFLGHSQIFTQPTSSVAMPTSSVPQPLELSERTPYPYPETGLAPWLTRTLYLAAVLLAIAGVLLLAGTAGRLWSSQPHKLTTKRR